VSAARTSRRLLGLYPRAWRARYGEELEALIVESSGGDRVPWRTRIDVIVAAGREHARELRSGGRDRPAGDRARSGGLLVLWAWAMFVCAGVAVQKISEHWQGATPSASRWLPSTAFDCLLAAAAVGSALALAGLAALLPSVASFLRSGGLRQVRGTVVRSTLLTLATAVAGVGVVIWAHRLSAADRTGRDAAYGAAVVVLALLAASCLASWVATASAVAHRLELSGTTLRVEALIAAAITLSMAAMTVATAVWWHGLVHAAPWFFADRRPGTPSAAFPPQLVIATAAMAIATALGAVGARRALQATEAARS
jgi:hypothetical protein